MVYSSDYEYSYKFFFLDQCHPKKPVISYSKQLVDLTADMVLTNGGSQLSIRLKLWYVLWY